MVQEQSLPSPRLLPLHHLDLVLVHLEVVLKELVIHPRRLKTPVMSNVRNNIINSQDVLSCFFCVFTHCLKRRVDPDGMPGGITHLYSQHGTG
jgi:hypothetical protein